MHRVTLHFPGCKWKEESAIGDICQGTHLYWETELTPMGMEKTPPPRAGGGHPED